MVAGRDGFQRVSVFELINETAREHFIGTTPFKDGFTEVEETLASKRVPRWLKEDKVYFRIVERNLAPDRAAAFIAGYAGLLARDGWTILTE